MRLVDSLDLAFLDLNIVPAAPFSLVYDGEGEGEGGGGESESGGEGDGGEGEGESTPPPPPKKKKEAPKVNLDPATQQYVNSLLAEERRKGQSKNQELIKQLETQKNRAGTSEAEQTRLQARIDELTSEYATKEELGKRNFEKQVKTLTGERDTARKDADNWKNLFQSTKISNALIGAATQAKAYNPEQVVTILASQTRLVEVTDEDGNVIPGQWQERVKIKSKDKEGKPVTLDLPATEAVKQMAELEEYANLFISGAAGGIGGNNSPKRGGGGGDEPPSDTAAYMQWRADRKKKGLPV